MSGQLQLASPRWRSAAVKEAHDRMSRTNGKLSALFQRRPERSAGRDILIHNAQPNYSKDLSPDVGTSGDTSPARSFAARPLTPSLVPKVVDDRLVSFALTSVRRVKANVAFQALDCGFLDLPPTFKVTPSCRCSTELTQGGYSL